MEDGNGCKCGAYYYGECSCIEADWSCEDNWKDKKIADLEAQLADRGHPSNLVAELRKQLAEAEKVIEQIEKQAFRECSNGEGPLDIMRMAQDYLKKQGEE